MHGAWMATQTLVAHNLIAKNNVVYVPFWHLRNWNTSCGNVNTTGTQLAEMEIQLEIIPPLVE
jgi:hypothetical protein